MSNEKETLLKISKYLGLDSVTDGRLRVKARIMEKVIFLTYQLNEGKESEWIDKIATRTCVSTRKIREDYIQPLVSDKILQRTGNGHIKFVGLPDDAVTLKIPKERRNDHSCFNCGKKIPLNLSFCSETCAKKYSERKRKGK